MSRPGRDDEPDRLYTLTGGRSRPGTDVFDLVTLVVTQSAPVPGMSSEDTAILRMCATPTSVAEIAAALRLPVHIVVILLSDLLDARKIIARHPHVHGTVTDKALLEKVLGGLRTL